VGPRSGFGCSTRLRYLTSLPRISNVREETADTAARTVLLRAFTRSFGEMVDLPTAPNGFSGVGSDLCTLNSGLGFSMSERTRSTPLRMHHARTRYGPTWPAIRSIAMLPPRASPLPGGMYPDRRTSL